MPMYDYMCSECGHRFTQLRSVSGRNAPECDRTKKCKAVLVPSLSTPRVFKPFWHPDLDEQPVHIESKKQLKKECEKRNVSSVILEDS